MRPAIVIRADATSRIGTGHVMRCLALASAAKKQDWSVRLIGRIDSNVLQSRLDDMEIDFTPLEKTYPDPSDLEQTLKLLSDGIKNLKITPWLVLDGYQFDARYHEAIRKAGYRLMVVDDYNHLDRYDCDALLNQNIGADRLDYKTSTDTRLLLGPRFALLRSEFLEWWNKKPEIPEKARRILVTMGGADPDDVTSRVLEGLALLNDPEIEVKVVVGPANPHLSKIEKIVSHAPFLCEELHGVRDMASVVAWADLAVTAAGSTCYELALLGVPFITVILAKNQENIARYLESADIAPTIGWHQNLSPDNLANLVGRLVGEPLSRVTMAAKGSRLSDGNGAGRILSFIGSEAR